MDNQIIQHTWETKEAKALTDKAIAEFETNSKTSVICPKCNKPPIKTITGNRCKIRCECGYIYDSEIYL